MICEKIEQPNLAFRERNACHDSVRWIPERLKGHIESSRMRKDKAAALCSIWSYAYRKAGWSNEVKLPSCTLKRINSRYKNHVETLCHLRLLNLEKNYSTGKFPNTYGVNHDFSKAKFVFKLKASPENTGERESSSTILGEKQSFLRECVNENAKQLHVASYVPCSKRVEYDFQLSRISDNPHRSFSTKAGGRHFTMWTQCPRIYRYGFQADEENLISFDVVACHAAILASLSRDHLMLSAYSQGDIYERIAKEKRGGRKMSRNDVKGRFTKSLNDPNCYQNRNTDWFFVTLREMFPVAHRFLEEHHPVGSLLLQKEAEWWLMEIVFAWLQAGNWGLTVHDEIVIKSSDLGRMQNHVKAFTQRYSFRYESTEINLKLLEQEMEKQRKKGRKTGRKV
ncbi:hypothetical protein OAG29_02220 [Planctomycetaceae bacterium]|nr:hypothetical protein [Planctomycetaceae bacterium]